MRIRARFSCLCAIGIAYGAASAAAAQTVAWNVPSSLNSQDKNAILKIAHRAGPDTPSSVSVHRLGGQCVLVQVQSAPVLKGDRVISSIVVVRQLRGPSCRPGRGGRPKRVGNWIAFLGPSNPLLQERWRIRQGSWYVDIDLGSGVPYGDAEVIVRAIREKRLLDRRTADGQSSTATSYVDANSIQTIRRPDTGLARRAPVGEYQVMTDLGGYGDSLTVRVGGGEVELQSLSQWQP